MNKFMIIFAFVSACTLSGCGRYNRDSAYITGSTSMCIDGITYLQFPTGASVKYNRNTLQPTKC